MRTLTQSKIKTYERCPYAYYLQEILCLPWPLKACYGSEQSAEQGNDFHFMVEQYLQRVPAEALLKQDLDPKVIEGFRTLLERGTFPDGRCFAEREVSADIADVRWLGVFDLISLSEDRLIICDWKFTVKPPREEFYAKSPQTRLYRYLAKRCGGKLFGLREELPAERIEMRYIFPNFPSVPINLRYSEQAYRLDSQYLSKMSGVMTQSEAGMYPRCKTAGAGSPICATCAYRLHCYPDCSVPPVESEIDDTYELQPMLFPDLDDSDREEQPF